MTEAEKIFWSRVRARQLSGYKFRRQVPMGGYIADFVCIECRLIVELDGGQHCGSAHDATRDGFLEAMGYKTVRFWNNEIHGNIEGALSALTLTLSQREREIGQEELAISHREREIRQEGLKPC